jgi:hypothetical protein
LYAVEMSSSNSNPGITSSPLSFVLISNIRAWHHMWFICAVCLVRHLIVFYANYMAFISTKSSSYSLDPFLLLRPQNVGLIMWWPFIYISSRLSELCHDVLGKMLYFLLFYYTCPQVCLTYL